MSNDVARSVKGLSPFLDIQTEYVLVNSQNLLERVVDMAEKVQIMS